MMIFPYGHASPLVMMIFPYGHASPLVVITIPVSTITSKNDYLLCQPGTVDLPYFITVPVFLKSLLISYAPFLPVCPLHLRGCGLMPLPSLHPHPDRIGGTWSGDSSLNWQPR